MGVTWRPLSCGNAKYWTMQIVSGGHRIGLWFWAI
jgi:hypothetical protein